MILLDTNIIIDYLKKESKVVAYIDNLQKSNVAITTIVLMELYRGVLNKVEFSKIKKELKGINIIDLNEAISEVALHLGETYALSHRMDIPDTLIAATALVYDLELKTYNLKDFQFIPLLKVSNKLEF